jgi:hypothetical protein
VLEGRTVNIKQFAEKNNLRKMKTDVDGTVIILGRYGHIYEYNDAYMGVIIIPNPPRQKMWGYARTALTQAGLKIVQNGDGEGSAIFSPHKPVQVQAALKAAHCYQKHHLSPERAERVREILRTLRGPDGKGTLRRRTSRQDTVGTQLPPKMK